MKNSFFFILILLPCILPLGATSDPFYLKLFLEGKELIVQKKYVDAIDNFRVAEFGLQNELSVLRELYIYYSLAFYKNGKKDEAKKILDKLTSEFGVKDFQSLERPRDIDPDLLAMFTALRLIQPFKAEVSKGGSKAKEASSTAGARLEPRTAQKTIAPPPQFMEVYSQTFNLILNNRLQEGEKGIKSLRDMDKKNPLIQFLQGLLVYQKRDFSAAAKKLEEAVTTGAVAGEELEKALYYLCLAHYQAGNFGLTLFYCRQANENTRNQLAEVVAKINEWRSSAITQLGKDFARRDFDKLRKQFSGDGELCHDFLRYLLDRYRYRTQYLKDIIELCLDHPSCYDENFILLAIDYFRSRSEIKPAVTLIEASRFMKDKKPQYVQVYLTLGELYFELKKYKKALEVFEEIRTFAAVNNPDVERWVEKVKSSLNEPKK